MKAPPSAAPLTPCVHCRGFVPAAEEVCPHCDRPGPHGARPPLSRARLLGLLAACGGGALAVTLMACYGLPPCDSGDPGCSPPDFATVQDAADGGPSDGGCGDAPCGDGGKG